MHSLAFHCVCNDTEELSTCDVICVRCIDEKYIFYFEKKNGLTQNI